MTNKMRVKFGEINMSWKEILKTDEDMRAANAYIRELHGKYGTEYRDHRITNRDAIYRQFDNAYKYNKQELVSTIRSVWNSQQAGVMADAEGIQGNYLIML